MLAYRFHPLTIAESTEFNKQATIGAVLNHWVNHRQSHWLVDIMARITSIVLEVFSFYDNIFLFIPPGSFLVSLAAFVGIRVLLHMGAEGNWNQKYTLMKVLNIAMTCINLVAAIYRSSYLPLSCIAKNFLYQTVQMYCLQKSPYWVGYMGAAEVD